MILLTPQGRLFSQAVAQELSRLPRLALICGHYEGVDERVREHLVTDEISVGDYVLTGGELPAMIVVDAVSRLVPGVLDAASTCQESHSDGLLEYPQYTRPPEFRGWRVPDVLLSGQSRADRGLAAPGVAAAHPGPPAGLCWPARTCRRVTGRCSRRSADEVVEDWSARIGWAVAPGSCAWQEEQ